MKKTKSQLIESYITTIRELINSKAQKYIEPTKTFKTFSDYIKSKLNIKDLDEWGFLCSCMDLIEDTNLAIENFIKFEVDGPTKYDDIGEKYLRLYGFLNATYMQQNSVLTLAKIFKVAELSKNKKQIFDLKMREIRNKLASHSDSYRKGRNAKKDTFVLSRIQLSGKRVTYGSNIESNFENLDLSTLLEEHSTVLLEILDSILEKGIAFILGSNIKIRSEFLEKLNDLREEKKGNIVISIPKRKKIIFTVYGK